MTPLQILTKEEEKSFKEPPQLTYQQKEYFFKLPNDLLEAFISIDDSSNKALLILMFGYFKATYRFFDIKSDDESLAYISERYQLGQIGFTSHNIRTVQRYKKMIRAYLGIEPYDAKAKEKLQQEAIVLANNFVHRKKILYTLIDVSKKLKIEVPRYTELLRIISIALNHQKTDILKRLESHIDDERLNVLNDLLDRSDNYKNRYIVMLYRRLEHATNRKTMLLSLERFQNIQSKFNATQPLIEATGITPKIAQYYAKWIEKGKISQLTQKDQLNTKFLLLSFVYYQYFIRNDNLIDRFITVVQSTKSTLLRIQKEFSYQQEPNKNRLIQSLEESNLSILNEIDSILKSEDMDSSNKVECIKQIVQ